MDVQYGNSGALNWLWLVGLLAIVWAVAAVSHRSAVRRFATANLLPQINRASGGKSIACGLLSLLAITAIIVGLVDIRWGKMEREVPQKGIEVVFLLDVSRSMLAEDVSPNRLERAKQGIRDMIDEMAGDRIGLVLFSGDARQHIPLTRHYDDFKQRLDEASPLDIQLGGSNLGKALTVASEAFLEKTSDHKAVVLITDGEDHTSQPVEVAQRVNREDGVRIFTIGIGDMANGARIPTGTDRSFLEHEGEQVWSKLDGEVLERIAMQAGGAYIPAATKRVDMAAVYHRFIASVAQREFQSATVSSYIPRYHWFMGCALTAVLLEAWLRSAGTRSRSAQASHDDMTTMLASEVSS